MNLYQCKLQRGTGVITCWIEERGAKVGYRVEILPDKNWWDVVEVYQPPMTKEQLSAKQRNDRNALPSIVPAKGG